MRPVLSLLWKGVAVTAVSALCVMSPAEAQFQTCDGGRCPPSREEPRERERRSDPRSPSSENPRTFGDQREERARGAGDRPAPSDPPRTFRDNREERRERPAPTNPPPTFNDNRGNRPDRDRDRPDTRPPRPDRPPQGDHGRPRPDRPPPGWDQGQRPPPGWNGQRPPPGWNGQRPPPGWNGQRPPPGWDGGRPGRYPPGWNGHRPYPPGYDRRPRRYSDDSGLWPGIVAGVLTIPFNPWPSQPSYTPRYGYAWDGTELPSSAPELGDSARNAPRFQVASRSRLPALPRGYHYRMLKNWIVMVEDRSLRVAQVMMNYDRMR